MPEEFNEEETKFAHPRMLATKSAETIVLPKVGDEIYANGPFRFNVSATLEWLKQNPLPIVDVPISIWGSFDNKKDCYVAVADLLRPIVIAEIAPDYCDFIPDYPKNDWYSRGYVCIDRQHRIAKATRLGMETLPAVVLRMEQHIPFLYAGYERYMEYWNGKLKDRTEDAQRWERSKKR